MVTAGSLQLRVSALWRLAEDVSEFKPSHVVSITEPGFAGGGLRPLFGDAAILSLQFRDGDSPSAFPPTTSMVEDLIAFLRTAMACPGDQRLLLHCHLGASRSPAAAYVAFALLHGPGREQESFSSLMTATRKPWPNRRLVVLADEILERRSALVAPVDQYRAAHPLRLSAYGRLNRKRASAP